MLGPLVFDVGHYLVYQIAYNIKGFCLYTFHKYKIIFDVYSLISKPVTFCTTICEVRGNPYFLDYISLDYFHKIKTGFHEMNRFRDTETDQLKGTTCSSFLAVNAVYRQCLDTARTAFSLLSEAGLFSSSRCPGLWNCLEIGEEITELFPHPILESVCRISVHKENFRPMK